jgi:hypothetical protein
LFAEPGVILPKRFAGLPCTRRDVPLGPFPNWYLALAELVMREPKVDPYFLCQDDVVFCRGLRAYLEERLWPAPKVGVVSLYRPSHFTSDKVKGFHVADRGWATWGALAYIFPNPSAHRFLCDPRVVNHRRGGPADGMRNIDSLVGWWCRDVKLPYYVHTPSLAQHIGATSTIWKTGTSGATGKRRADEFPGEEFDVSKEATW